MLLNPGNLKMSELPMHWTYKTNIGTFWIKPAREKNRFILGIDDDALGSYSSAPKAADEVLTCTTGHWPWDKQITAFEPSDLTKWTQHK